MIYYFIADITRAMEYILLLGLFWQKDKKSFSNIQPLIMLAGITALQIVSLYVEESVVQSVLPLLIMLEMALFGIGWVERYDRKAYFAGIMEAYVFSVLIEFVSGVCVGIIGYGISHSYLLDFSGKLFVSSVARLITIVLIWLSYEKLLRFSKRTVVNVFIILGAFVLFFQQFIRFALGRSDYNFATIVALLLYFTMIFTAFMLLQHNRLTAKQQAIEEDNRQMSQRLHRSKDVLGVVSQVVASEDHIDPKLRKELADFCDDEMNEMQDRALGANLIGDTGIELVNVMLQKQMIRCADLNISFDVMIPAPIDGYICEIGISVTEFMRMLNDLLKNAVKAILSSENTHRELLLIMGEAGNDCFEIRLYDSGVPFPPKILEHLGERGNTTDGTGNGIADTVETLRHYRASFVIEPIEPGTDIYTKCIHIAFDEQGCLPRTGEQ